MKRYLQFEPLVIKQWDTSHWSAPLHTHDFYELILIGYGRGEHTINGNQFPYSAGDVFLLGPCDSHVFRIEENSQFSVLSFTEAYLHTLNRTSSNFWKYLRNYNLHTSQDSRGSLMANATDQHHFQSLFAILMAEQHSGDATLVRLLVNIILSLLERQLTPPIVETSYARTPVLGLVQSISDYISQHITKPEKLRIEQLAEVFHYSSGHLSSLFKQQVGLSLQQYIIQYKLKLVEKQLILSSRTISQIAEEYGFADLSHLNKLFKRYYHHTPIVYRRDFAGTPLASSYPSVNLHSKTDGFIL